MVVVDDVVVFVELVGLFCDCVDCVGCVEYGGYY